MNAFSHNPHQRARTLAVIFIAWLILTTSAAIFARSAHLAWNRTDSIPIGFYSLHPIAQPLIRQQLVAVPPPSSVITLVTQRDYLHPGDYLFKRVVAVANDHVCLDNDFFVVNGITLGSILDADRAGRPLPHFTFCGKVTPGTVWLGTTSPRSFDSRYFGPVTTDSVAAALEPRWTF